MGDFGDFNFSLDVEDLFGDSIDKELVINTTEVSVTPICIKNRDQEYTFYITDLVEIAQEFNKEENLDELSTDKIYLLPEGIEIINTKLLSRFEKLPDIVVSKEDIEKSLMKDFSNLILRNHLKYVKKMGDSQ